jgi:hypothetical protein
VENDIKFRVSTFQVVLRNYAYHINHVYLTQIKSTSHYSAGSATQLHEFSSSVWVQSKHDGDDDDDDDTQLLQLVKLLSNPTDGVVCLYSYKKFVLHCLDRACIAIIIITNTAIFIVIRANYIALKCRLKTACFPCQSEDQWNAISSTVDTPRYSLATNNQMLPNFIFVGIGFTLSCFHMKLI